MNAWLEEKVPTPQAAVEKVLRFFHSKARPCFVGEVSLATGMTLDKAQRVIDELVIAEALRPATEAEIKRLDAHPGSHVYAISGSVSLKLAHRP